MNLQEYINQKNPQKLAPLSVKVNRSDLKSYGNFATYKGMELERVEILNGFNYIVINGSGCLWTISNLGIPEKQSVFYLIN